MIDLFAVALGVVAATLIVDEVIVRSNAATAYDSPGNRP